MSQEEVVALYTCICLAACCGILAGLGRGEERPLHQRCRRSLWFAGNGRSCCSTPVGSISHISTNAFREKPSVRSFVRPSIHTKAARLCNFPRSCSIYKPCFSTTHCQCVLLSFITKCCLLPSLAGALGHSTRSFTHGPRPTGHGHRGCRMCVDPKLNGAHPPGSLAASRVRGALVIRAW
jgi:hypothetical protein